MKTLSIFTLTLLLSLASAQIGVAQNRLTRATLHHSARGQASLSFSVQGESNVRTYRIEASDDGQTFTPIATIQPGLFAAGVRTYRVPLDAAQAAYKHYRVCLLSMDHQQRFATVTPAVEAAPALASKE